MNGKMADACYAYSRCVVTFMQAHVKDYGHDVSWSSTFEHLKLLLLIMIMKAPFQWLFYWHLKNAK